MYRIFAVIALLLCATPAQAKSALELLFGCKPTENVCRIKRSLGGYLLDFNMALTEARVYGVTFVVDGPCDSACAWLASFARPNVCVTENASVGFHKGKRLNFYDAHDKPVPDH